MASDTPITDPAGSIAGAATIVTGPANLPNFTRSEVTQVSTDLQVVEDLLAGTRTMWEKSQTGAGGVPYIFKWQKEDPKVYDIRRKCETVFEGLGRTLNAAVGMLFATAPRVTWNKSEAAMTEIWANVDAAGTAGPVLVKRFTEACLRDGLGAIVVDHPAPPIDPETNQPVPITAANETALGLRPTWALYSRRQIINWRTATVENRKLLTLVVFSERADVDEGDFGTKSVQRYRVLRLILTPSGYQATWRLYEQLAGTSGGKAEEFTIAGQGVFRNRAGDLADFLPVSVAYTGRTDAPMCATIPLMGVAWANLAHWQQSTDLRFYRMISAHPQPLVKGELAPDAQTGKAQKLGLGPLVAVHVASDGDYLWREIEGKSMVQLESGIKEKLAQMGQLGLSFLTTDTRAAETADAKRLDATAQNATLATAAQGIDDCVNSALEQTAWYLGIDKADAPVLSISRDFESTTLDAQLLTAYVALVTAGFPKRPILEAMQAGGRLPADADLDLLEIEWEQSVVDAQNAKADAQAAQLATLAAKSGGTPNPQPDPQPKPMDGSTPMDSAA